MVFRGTRFRLVASLGSAMLFGSAALGQQTPLPPASNQPAKLPTAATAAAQERAQILADTQRLYQLAAELKIELVKSSPDTLSLAIVKKAAEIEQLSRSLNQRMKD